MKFVGIKADHGDCFMLVHGKTRILVDGGPPGVYKDFLRPSLVGMGASDDSPLELDLVVVSHIDRDHIAGLIDLTEELLEAGQGDGETLVEIDEYWHNSFSDDVLTKEMKQDLLEAQQDAQSANVELASFGGELELLSGHSHSTGLTLASVAEGRELTQNISNLGITRNHQWPGKFVMNPGGAGAAREIGILDPVKVTVIGPTADELAKLKKRWKKDLKKILKKEAEQELRLAAAKRLDRSVANLSSIVMVVEVNGASMLLTGDARGDHILKALEQAYGKQPEYYFDLVKMPHHGSTSSVTKDFVKRVKGKHYVMSGDGNHGNPSVETFERLFVANAGLDYQIHLTFSPDEIATHKKFAKHNTGDLLQTLSPHLDKLSFPDVDSISFEIEF